MPLFPFTPNSVHGVAAETVSKLTVPVLPSFVTNTISVAAPTYAATCCDDKVQGQAALTVVAGSHDLKVGYQYVRSNRSTYYYSVTNPDGSGFQAQYANGAPSQVVTFGNNIGRCPAPTCPPPPPSQ